ncbi:MAG: rhodanese-like domain-containing protein [Planctomycetota bacterium]
MEDIKTIDMDGVLSLLSGDDEVEFVDVRTPAEFREVHAPQAKNIPLDELDPEAYRRSRGERAADPVYVICKTGGRGKQAARRLVEAGFKEVVNVEGGMDAWTAAGAAVVRGKKTISLERQVRITAGFLVALGTLLGVTVNPWFLVVPGFVGCGLVFAGVTDFCGMGLLLARAPWNR